MFDVLVIGGGLAGSIAALVANQAGARVALASRSWGATALSTGALDIAYTPAVTPVSRAPRTLRENLIDIAAHRARHPYAVLGVERVINGVLDGFGLLRDALEPHGLAPRAPLEFEQENAGLASSLGALVPAGSALPSHWGMSFFGRATGTWAVAQLTGDASFDARRVALAIRSDAEATSGVTPELRVVNVSARGARTPLATARLFDDQELAQRLGAELCKQAKGVSGIVVPPVLGLSRHAMTLQTVTRAAGVPVVEALAYMPSAPGARLQLALEAAVRQRGVVMLGEVGEPALDGGRVSSLALASGERVAARGFVLASGRFVSGGVTWTDRCREALFGLPVVTELGPMEEDSPHPVVRESPLESHPLMTAGVQVNRALQPLADGRVPLRNVFAAGMVIGGFASRYALCADGVALATGVIAARGALERGA